MADVLSTGLSGLRALQRALDTTSHNIANVSTEGYTRQRAEFQTRPAESCRRRLDRHRRRNLDRAPRLRSVPRATDPQQRHQSRAARCVRFAGGACRQPVRRFGQWIVELAAEVHRRPQRSFHDAGIDSGAPGADFRSTCTGRSSQELRRAHARHVGRGQRPRSASKRRKSPRSRRESPGSTAKLRPRSIRAASLPTTCSTSAMRSSTSCRAR